MRGNSHVRCETGEKTEITSRSYLSSQSYISAEFFKLLTFGLPGVGNFEELLVILREWKVQKLIVAFDMDTLQKTDNSDKAQKKQENLFAILQRFAFEAMKIGVAVHLWTWNLTDGKGLDDLINNKKLPIEFDLRTNKQRGVTLDTVHYVAKI